jgi:thiamine biosynthesis lipoprotein
VVERVVGIPVSIEGGGDVAGAFAWLRWVDETFSTYRENSEISRIDRGELAVRDAHPLVRQVLGRCERLRRATRGYFDARASGRLDPSGLVKGWAAERAWRIAGGGCVDAGGDVRVGGRPWRVGVRHPHDEAALAAVVCLRDGAVATSGAYERGEHVLDPHTGRPPRGVLSVTVVGPDLATADAYATAAFAMGERGPAFLARAAAMVVLEGDRVLTTPAFDALMAGPPTAAGRP